MKTQFENGSAKRAFFGALDEIATHWVLLKSGRYDLEESANQIADIFVGGVGNLQSENNPIY